VVGWYGGSEEYALISSLRFSRETFHKQRLQAPISVTPEHHRTADRVGADGSKCGFDLRTRTGKASVNEQLAIAASKNRDIAACAHDGAYVAAKFLDRYGAGCGSPPCCLYKTFLLSQTIAGTSRREVAAMLETRKRRREISESCFMFMGVTFRSFIMGKLPLVSAISAALGKEKAGPVSIYAVAFAVPLKKASRSALIVAASVVGMPWGKPL